MQRAHFLAHRNYRYLKAGTVFALLALGIGVLFTPAGAPAHGGSPVGYFFGIWATLLLPILLWYGVRKRRTPRWPDRRQAGGRSKIERPPEKDRRNKSGNTFWRYGGTLQGWLSAHVALGMLFLLLVTLHAGVHLDGNLHTLSYMLALCITASGIYGVYAYLRHPEIMTRQLAGESPETLYRKLQEYAHEIRDLRARLPAHWQSVALEELDSLSRQPLSPAEAEDTRQLTQKLLQHDKIQERLARITRLDQRLRRWQELHTPLSIALLAAVLIHILLVVAYW